jgi:hypothetical protein
MTPTVAISVKANNPARTIFSDTYDDNGIKPIFIPANSYN